MSLKQVIVVRKDLKLPKGKMAAQVGHGAVGAMLAANKKLVKNWIGDGQKKVVLYCEDKKELTDLQKQCLDADLPCALITDAGHTVLKPNTTTCLGVGPGPEEKIDQITGHLKMVN